MSEKITNLEFPASVHKAAFCETKDDFWKFLLLIVNSTAGDENDAEALTMGIKFMCHEYLALVLSGKVRPYKISEETIKREKKYFDEGINEVNRLLTEMKIPMREGENGKMEFDCEEIIRRSEEL